MKKDPLIPPTFVILFLLIVQYIFGILVNLFIQFPSTKNESMLWAFARSQVSLVIHIILGTILLIGAFIVVVMALQSKNKQWIISANFGFFAILTAFIAGVQYVPSQQEIFSFLMAITFIVGVLAYGWGIYQSKK